MTRHIVDVHELEGHNQLFGIECDYTRGWHDGFDAAVHAVRNSPEAADFPVEPRSGSEGTATADEPPRRREWMLCGDAIGDPWYFGPNGESVPGADWSPWPAPVPGTHESDLTEIECPCNVIRAGFTQHAVIPDQTVGQHVDEFRVAEAWSRSNRKEPQP